MPKGRRRKSAKKAPVVKRRRRRSRSVGVLDLIQGAKANAKKALERLRREISEMEGRLAELMNEERDFLAEISGKAVSRVRALVAGPGRRRRRGRPARRGPTKADAFFAKLPEKFSLDEVRRLAGKLSGVSLAQWSRAKKIRKVGKGYAKQSRG